MDRQCGKGESDFLKVMAAVRSTAVPWVAPHTGLIWTVKIRIIMGYSF